VSGNFADPVTTIDVERWLRERSAVVHGRPVMSASIVTQFDTQATSSVTL
jgi:hypothetical protein